MSHFVLYINLGMTSKLGVFLRKMNQSYAEFTDLKNVDKYTDFLVSKLFFESY